MGIQKQLKKIYLSAVVMILSFTAYPNAYAITDNGIEPSCKGATTNYSITINLKSGQSSVIEYGLIGNGDATFDFIDSSLTQSEFVAQYLITPVDIRSDLGAIFGGKADDCLQALGVENSTLFGGPGNDRLAGNSSHNILNGGLGSDSMFGKYGNDTYNGGEGTNLIFDEAGDDNYIINATNSLDKISDIDGMGSVFLNNSSKPISGGNLLKGKENYWISNDKLTGYTISIDKKYSQTLIINLRMPSNQKIHIKNWKDGDLGIRLRSFWCKIWSGFCSIE